MFIYKNELCNFLDEKTSKKISNHLNSIKMGLFSKLFSGASTPSIHLNSEAEAVFAILYCCMRADGAVSDEEISSLVSYGNTNPMLSRLDLLSTYERMLGIVNKHGIPALVAAALPVITAERRPTVFAVAVDFMLADGVVGQKEQELLADLQKGLTVADEQATRIIEVLLIKNK